jgi:8-oxo-dGTP pyrophosphatase MutT (NUDIX family)
VPGARLVIFRGDELLLQKRTDFQKWSFIGGTAEEGESLTQTIKREVQEEVGIQIEDPLPFGFSSNPQVGTVTYPNGHRCQYFVLIYACERFSGTPRIADEESSDIRWFSPDQLPSGCMPAVQATVTAFKAWRRTGAFQLLD